MPRQGIGPVSKRVGIRIRSLRGRTSGEWIAREANALARLRWTRTTVWRIENGKRGLTAEELIVLPAILTAATGRPIALPDLLAGEIRLGNARIRDGAATWRQGYESAAKREIERIVARYPAFFEKE
jgi:hypothetical protein